MFLFESIRNNDPSDFSVRIKTVPAAPEDAIEPRPPLTKSDY